mgnify:CR=1 FL=1
MQDDWTQALPGMVYVLLGLGGLAAAMLAILKFWRALVPPASDVLLHDIETIKADIHDIRTRVTALELDVARIDQPSIAKHFDSIEGKIDKLYEFLLERFAEGVKDTHR